MPYTPSIVTVEEFEDFLSYHLQTAADIRWRQTTATGGTFSVQSIDAGWLRLAMTTAETAAGIAAGAVQFRPDRMGGPMSFLARLKVSDADKASVFVGFTDANNDTVVIEDENGALNTVATDAVGVLLEGEQLEQWQGVSVKGGNDGDQITIPNQANVQNNEWHEVGVTVNREGGVYFMVDGQNTQVYDGLLDPTVQYCWAVSGDGRATAYNLDVDYICFKGYRRQGT